jgi:hypothetical protein
MNSDLHNKLELNAVNPIVSDSQLATNTRIASKILVLLAMVHPGFPSENRAFADLTGISK